MENLMALMAAVFIVQTLGIQILAVVVMVMVSRLSAMNRHLERISNSAFFLSLNVEDLTQRESDTAFLRTVTTLVPDEEAA